jgi:hypothetical protein
MTHINPSIEKFSRKKKNVGEKNLNGASVKFQITGRYNADAPTLASRKSSSNVCIYTHMHLKVFYTLKFTHTWTFFTLRK